jgi:hypothetical protein
VNRRRTYYNIISMSSGRAFYGNNSGRTAYTQGGRAGGRGFGQQRPSAQSAPTTDKGSESALPFLTWGYSKENKSIEFLRLFGEYCDVHMKASIGPAFSSVPPAFGAFDVEPLLPTAVGETPLSTIVVQEYLHMKKFWLTEKRTAELQRLSTFSLVWSRLSDSSRSELAEDELIIGIINRLDMHHYGELVRNYLSNEARDIAPLPTELSKLWTDINECSQIQRSDNSFSFGKRICRIV